MNSPIYWNVHACRTKNSMWFKVVWFCSCQNKLVARCGAQVGCCHLADNPATVRYALLIYFVGFCFRHFVLASKQNQQQSQTIQIHFSLRLCFSFFSPVLCATFCVWHGDFNTRIICLLCYVLRCVRLLLSWSLRSVLKVGKIIAHAMFNYFTKCWRDVDCFCFLLLCCVKINHDTCDRASQKKKPNLFINSTMAERKTKQIIQNRL